jgi:hypothetical protein
MEVAMFKDDLDITDAEQEALVDEYIRTELKDSLREYEEHPERFIPFSDVKLFMRELSDSYKQKHKNAA